MGRIINIRNQRTLDVMKSMGYRIMPPISEDEELIDKKVREKPIASVEIPDRIIGPQYERRKV